MKLDEWWYCLSFREKFIARNRQVGNTDVDERFQWWCWFELKQQYFNLLWMIIIVIQVFVWQWQYQKVGWKLDKMEASAGRRRYPCWSSSRTSSPAEWSSSSRTSSPAPCAEKVSLSLKECLPRRTCHPSSPEAEHWKHGKGGHFPYSTLFFLVFMFQTLSVFKRCCLVCCFLTLSVLGNSESV